MNKLLLAAALLSSASLMSAPRDIAIAQETAEVAEATRGISESGSIEQYLKDLEALGLSEEEFQKRKLAALAALAAQEIANVVQEEAPVAELSKEEEVVTAEPQEEVENTEIEEETEAN